MNMKETTQPLILSNAGEVLGFARRGRAEPKTTVAEKMSNVKFSALFEFETLGVYVKNI